MKEYADSLTETSPEISAALNTLLDGAGNLSAVGNKFYDSVNSAWRSGASLQTQLSSLTSAISETATAIAEITKTLHAEPEEAEAKGNVALAAGTAKAKGTLMGELGPELVVSNGRYFVAGQNGAEFVDLPGGCYCIQSYANCKSSC